MPIKIPDNLPAGDILREERVPLIREERAIRQDIRPLKIALLNLMPDKLRTETQILRVLGSTPLQIEVTLIRTGSYTSTHTAEEHLLNFYVTLDDLDSACFDGLIVTGAPLAHVAYEDVKYWDELTRIFEWSRTHVFSSFMICWGAQAALHYFHGIDKFLLPEKQFGVYAHYVTDPYHPLVRGFDDVFHVPVSRNGEIDSRALEAVDGIDILASSADHRACLAYEPQARRVYMFHHLEYDGDTLKREYERDQAQGLGTPLPANYFPGDDAARDPLVTWRSVRTLLFANWIGEVYQQTPYDLAELGCGNC